MDRQGFRQVEELYRAVREPTGGAREALLARADPELRREVEILLARPDDGGSPDPGAVGNGAHAPNDSTVTQLTAGACLGRYRLAPG